MPVSERGRRILVNATNTTGAGARSSTLYFVPALVKAMPEASLTFLLPDQPAFRSLSLGRHARALYFPRANGPAAELQRLRELFFTVPRLAREVGAQVCLTLGDLGAFGLPCPQVILLRQPLLVYSRQETAGLAAWHPLKRWYLAQHFGLAARRAARLIVQTPVMADRAARRYGLDRERISIIPQALMLDPAAEGTAEVRCRPLVRCTKPKRLLFLAAYYPHKNHSILPAVAREVQRRGLSGQVHIFLTLEPEEISAASLGPCLHQHSSLLTNLGRLSRSEVGAALRASTALFLPTLLESYGNIYLEALACGRPILTSDRDFARWMCRDLAFYFDPLDARSIVDAIESLPEREADDYAARAQEHLRSFPKDWNEVAERFAAAIRASA